jgi:hypothetical protein
MQTGYRQDVNRISLNVSPALKTFHTPIYGKALKGRPCFIKPFSGGM